MFFRSLFVCLTCITLYLLAGAIGPEAHASQSITPATPAASAPQPAANELRTPDSLARCQVGVYLLSLHELAFSDDTFDATLWLWVICPDDFPEPMDTLEFVNANSVDLSVGHDQHVAGGVYRPTKVSGTFQHDWDLTDFPFDHQTLEIIIEDAEYTTEYLVYDPDEDQSDVHPDVSHDRWSIADFGISAAPYTYNTTFGDPTVAPDNTSSDYSRLRVSIALERNAITGFFKLTSVVYIAFLLSMISFLIHMEAPTHLGTRLTLVSGALFAAAINMQVASSTLGNESELSLVDKIHLSAFVAILFAAVAAIASSRLQDVHGPTASIRRANYAAMVLSAIVFLVSNIVLISSAARVE